MADVTEQGCYVAFIGSFNPAIITPHWMARNDIISTAEADDARIDVIHRDVARFATSGLKFEFLTDRCFIFAEAEPFIKLVDIVGVMFLQCLPHTPMSALGINYYVHADLGEVEKRIRFGRKLAPVAPWSSFGDLLDTEKFENVGGLVDLSMQATRADGYDGFIRATVQPSNKFQNLSSIFVQVSHHFEAKPGSPTTDQAEAPRSATKSGRKRLINEPKKGVDQQKLMNYAQICVDEFQNSVDASRKIIDEFLAEADRS